MRAQLHLVDRWNLNTSIGVIGGVGSLEMSELRDVGIVVQSYSQDKPILKRVDLATLSRHPSAMLLCIPAILRERKGTLEASLWTAPDLRCPVAVDLAHLLYLLTTVHRGLSDQNIDVDDVVSEFATFITTAAATDAVYRRLPGNYKILAYLIWAAYPIIRRGINSIAGWFMYLDEAALSDMQAYLKLIVDGVSVLTSLDIFDAWSASIVRDWLAAAYLLALANSDARVAALGDYAPGTLLKTGERIRVEDDVITIDSEIADATIVLQVRDRVFDFWDVFVRANEIIRIPVFYFYLHDDDERAAWEKAEISMRRILAQYMNEPTFRNVTAARDKAFVVDVDYREI